MAETLNLYQKLLKITESIGKMEKEGRGDGIPYRFIEQSMIVAKLRPLLAEHGVMIMPEAVGHEVQKLETTDKFGKPKVQFSSTVSMRFTVINADKPDERMTCNWSAGEALDGSDKATNKAVTAANKTFLMKLFNISEKEDPDTKRPGIEQTEVNPADFYAAKAQLTKFLTKEKNMTLPEISEFVKVTLKKPRIETLEDVAAIREAVET